MAVNIDERLSACRRMSDELRSEDFATEVVDIAY